METPNRRPSSPLRIIRLPRKDATTGAITHREIKTVFDFRGISTLEDIYDTDLQGIAERFAPVDGAPPRVKIKDLVNLIYAGSRTHHSELTSDNIFTMLDEAVGADVPISDLMKEAFKAFEQGGSPDQTATEGNEPAGAGANP